MDSLVVLVVVITVFVMMFAAAGFRTIKDSHNGIVTRFGRYERTYNPGLRWVWPFIERIRRIDAYGTVLVRIDTPGHTGRVKVGDEEWRATSADRPISSGAGVRIVGIKEDRLIVRQEV